MKLTNDFLKNAKPPAGDRLEVRDDDEAGLIFRVTAAGVRSWSVRYTNSAGEHRRKALGQYPSVGLAKAREEARKVKGVVAGGTDVVAADRATRAEARRRKLRTFGGAGEAYFADAKLGLHKPNAAGAKRPKTTAEEERIYEKLVEPEFGKTPLSDLTRAEIQAFVSKVSKKSASNGRFCRNVLRQILSYAVWKDLIPSNPAQQIAVIPSAPRERVLTDAEVKAIWLACERPASVENLSLSIEMGIALRLGLTTLLRGGEVVGAAWSEIDLKAKTWTIPAVRMKGKRPHLVPLSATAVALLEEARDTIKGKTYVFETGDDPVTHLEAMSYSRALTRMAATLKIPDAHAHDFRRTGATNLTSERAGIPRFIVSQVIAHASDTGGAAAVTGRHYDLNDYLPDKRRALDAWAALLAEIVSGVKRADNVSQIRAA
jgi:integrase